MELLEFGGNYYFISLLYNNRPTWENLILLLHLSVTMVSIDIGRYLYICYLEPLLSSSLEEIEQDTFVFEGTWIDDFTVFTDFCEGWAAIWISFYNSIGVR